MIDSLKLVSLYVLLNVYFLPSYGNLLYFNYLYILKNKNNRKSVADNCTKIQILDKLKGKVPCH